MKKLRITTAVVATMALAMSGMSAGATSAPTVRRKAQSSSNLSRGIQRPAPKPDALSSARSRGKLSRAEYTLERATSLFRLSNVRERYGDVERPDPHDATLLMRDLALSKHNLSGSDRRRANRILARPTDKDADPQGDGYEPGTLTEQFCSDADGASGDDVCFTYVESTSDAVPPTDTTPPNGFPDYVEDAAGSMATVWQKEINDLGYNPPQLDANSVNNGGSAKLDIYFADIGDNGLYGYCTTDEPGAGNKQKVSAYCVLDNDYSPSQYDAPPPEVTGTQALQVTLAHEFFHAVQFNYDWKEAKFLMEGTAVWIEDEVYDAINASYAFLFDSALHQPEIPLDAFQKGDDDENFEYGAFIFFTQLAESYEFVSPPGVNMVRKVWNEAAKPNKKGMNAVQSAINDEGFPGPSTPFRDFFVWWGATNHYFDAFYSEGHDLGDSCDNTLDAYFDVLHCRYPPFDGMFQLGPGQNSKTRSVKLDRRSHRYIVIVPNGSTPLKTIVDLPQKNRGGEASLLILNNNFTINYRRIKLNKSGSGSKSLNLVGNEWEIILVLSNTGPHNKETYKFRAEA
ncbi:MAG TPA: MXAN_6640 family putative metalloprotease [Actinomycetota bacterium]|nr:MXAN_6640 family putative metalloprotease [Actinomycetota bacterium]